MNINEARDLEHVKTLVEDIHHRLFGNGQPGIVDEHDERIKSLEKTKYMGKGALWVAGIVWTILEAVVHLVWSAHQ